MRKYLDTYTLLEYFFRLVFCALGIFLLGVSIAFNSRAFLGTDAVAVFFSGVGSSLNIDLGLATNVINCILTIIVLFIDRKYISFGTIIYALALGPSVNFGINLYNAMGISDDYISRFLVSILGLVVAILGLGMFISAKIGIDPWSSLAMIFGEKFNKSFGIMKVSIDVVALLVGFFMGGKVGEITLVSSLVGGPCIQKVSEFIDNMFTKMLRFSDSEV